MLSIIKICSLFYLISSLFSIILIYNRILTPLFISIITISIIYIKLSIFHTISLSIQSLISASYSQSIILTYLLIFYSSHSIYLTLSHFQLLNHHSFFYIPFQISFHSTNISIIIISIFQYDAHKLTSHIHLFQINLLIYHHFF